MTEVGLWILSKKGIPYIIKKDPNGYPDLVPLAPSPPLKGLEEKKDLCKSFYEDLTGKKYSHPDATTRQVLWDFLEVAIDRLP